MTPSQLYSRVLPHVPGCPEPQVDQAIMDAAAEFAERTQILFSVEAPIPLVDDVSVYSLPTDPLIEPDLFRHVYCGTRELIPATPSSLHDQLPGWETGTSTEPTHYNCYETPGSIHVYPTPSGVTTQTLRIVASWVPAFGAASFPDELGRGYYRDLVEGAKAALMVMADRKWSNPQMAAVHRQNFEGGITEARIKAIHGKAAGTITARPRQFGRS